jgi:hypothetical protein
MEAAGLLEQRLGVAREGAAVARYRFRREEPERIEVRAAQVMSLDDRIRCRSPQS